MILRLVFCFGTLLPSLLAADPIQKSFAIPAATAEKTLEDFSEQADTQIIYLVEEVRGVATNAVKGKFAIPEALAQLVAGTGLRVEQDQKTGAFVIRRDLQSRPVTENPDPNNTKLPPAPMKKRTILSILSALMSLAVTRAAENPVHSQTAPALTARPFDNGSLEGTLLAPLGGKPLAGVRVLLPETGATANVGLDGRFHFPSVPPGTYTLVATGERFSTLRITDVVIRPGVDTAIAPETMPAMVKESRGDRTQDVVVKATQDVLKMEKFVVSDIGVQRFLDSNVDLPRTLDDPQPRIVFDAAKIEQSGSVNLEAFFKEELPQNTVSLVNQQNPTLNTNTSTVNLRSLGTGQVLILINGRRIPSVSLNGADNQPDLNGYPLSAIDHIEVLTSANSAIYGGGATAGVINVVLKKNYSGSELQLSYANEFNTDAHSRNVSFNEGFALEKGRTQVFLSLNYIDSSALANQDRPFNARGYYQIIQNAPSVIFPTTKNVAPPSPPLGATPNIASANGTPLFGAGSPTFTNVPAGYAGGGGLAPFLANAGTYDLQIAPTYNFKGNLLPLYQIPTNKSIVASVTRNMTDKLQFFVDFRNSTSAVNNPYGPLGTSTVTVPANSPNNPFGQSVLVTYPSPVTVYIRGTNTAVSLTEGFRLNLAHDWIVEGDYTWNRYNVELVNPQNATATAINAAIAAGTFNVFSDMIAHPVDPATVQGLLQLNYLNHPNSTSNDAALRGAGPIFSLPAGKVVVKVDAEHLKTGRANGLQTTLPNNPAVVAPTQTLYLGKFSDADDLAAEAQVPLVSASNAISAVRLLDLNLAARQDWNLAETGTTSIALLPAPAVAPVITHNSVSNSHASESAGIRYKPIDDLMFRASYENAFLAPTYAQLAVSPPPTTLSSVIDPRRGGTTNTSVSVLTGGNPGLTPQLTKTWTAGVVLTPRFLKGLRLSVDYNHFNISNVISAPGAQIIVNNEAIFPGRVVRGPVPANDAFGVGPITTVDNTNINLNAQIVESYDAQLDYVVQTASVGTFDFNVLATWLEHSITEAFQGVPVNNIGAESNIKVKANAHFVWSYHRLKLGVGANYWDRFLLSTNATTIAEEGSAYVPSKIYYSAQASYRFPNEAKSWLGGTSLSLVVDDVLNKTPPANVSASNNAYVSYFAGPFMARYTLTFKKQF